MTQKNRRKWCYWMSECTDYEGYACGAHLAEGHIFECTFKEDGEYVEYAGYQGRIVRKPIHPKGGGACEDFRSPEEEVAERLKRG